MTIQEEGWAVVMNRKINVCTVAPTRRAAIVNWLINKGHSGLHRLTDEEIDALWNNERTETTTVCQVRVSMNP